MIIPQVSDYQLLIMRIAATLDTPVAIEEPNDNTDASIAERFAEVGVLISLGLMEESVSGVRVNNNLYRLASLTPEGRVMIDTCVEITH